MQGPNRDAVTLPEGTEDQPTKLADLHPGDSTHPNGSWVDFTQDAPATEAQQRPPQPPQPYAAQAWGAPSPGAESEPQQAADTVRPERVVTLIPGGYIYWGAGKFRPTALPEKWHLTAAGEVDAGE